MFVPGGVPKTVPPHLSGIRPPGEQYHPQGIPGTKPQFPQRPQPPAMDKMRNPLLREVDDELRKLKSQFDMIRGDQYQAKPSNLTETMEGLHSANTPSSSALKSVVGYQPQPPASRTAMNQPYLPPTGSTGTTTSQTNIDVKGLSGQSYAQNKKTTQSFEVKKDSLYSPEIGRQQGNPEQQYRTNPNERNPSYKNYVGSQQQESYLDNVLAPQNNPIGQAYQPKSATATQQKNPYASYGGPSGQDSLNKEFKPSNMQSPPQKPYSTELTSSIPKTAVTESFKADTLQFALNTKTDSSADLYKVESLRTETVKQSSDYTSANFKPNGIKSELRQDGSSSLSSDRQLEFTGKPQPPAQKKPPQEKEQPKQTAPLRQNPHRQFDTAPVAKQAPPVNREPPAAKVPTTAVGQQPVQQSTELSSSGSSDINRYNSFNSERVQYQDPNPYVSNETKQAAEWKQPRQLSPSQRERDASIKKYEAKKVSDLEQRIGTLTKSNDTANREVTQLKHQVTRLTEELKLVERIKAEYQNMQTNVKQTNQRYQKLQVQLEDAQVTISKKDITIQDLQAQVRRLKQTVEADKSEGGFNVALKAQIEENQRVKERFAEKDEQIEHLRQNNKTLRTQLDSYRNEMEIEKLKKMTELKNIETTNDIELQRLNAQISSLQKVVSSLDEKFKYMMKEDRKKDQFLVNYLKGKTHDPNDKDLIVNFFKQWEQVPKLTVSELLRQQYRIQEDLKKEIEALKATVISGYGGRGSPSRPAY